MMTEKDKIRECLVQILNDVKQMVLSTSNQNSPWCATVFFAFDSELNIYFFSTSSRRHSKEIAVNKRVSGAVAREHKLDLEEKHRGVQFEGKCTLISNSEVNEAYDLLRKRFPSITKFHLLKDATKELYKIHVDKFVLFDTLNFPKDPRKELQN
ncbi:MAG: pyridoxamine 5'-phosphate oxidase family protein [Candidatus Aenigmarchaeota archaeon]|nr:pyridoxamine 5'-phosphate oxidase family protein [Candidatus Aenigmarchaeota archaeon]